MYLFWLKTGLDYQTIACHFEINDGLDVLRYLKQVRNGLLEFFVEENLGIGHLTREEWISNNSNIATELFCEEKNQLILVADGTYCYIQKSSNNYFQRKTFSVQKKTHLLKPFVVTTTNGLIVDIFGLHEATKNDSTILIEILEKNHQLISLLKDNDIILLDRGFRDCIQTLRDVYNLNPKMPSTLKKKKNN